MKKLLWVTGGAVIVAILICGYFLKKQPPSSASDYAAWAQGISTTLAVITALFVPAWQRQDAIARELREKRMYAFERTHTAFQLAHFVQVVIVRVMLHCTHVASADRNLLTTAAAELEAIGVALDKYSPTDFAAYEQLRPLIEVMAVQTEATAHLHRALARMDTIAVSAEIVAAFTDSNKRLAGSVEGLKNVMEKARTDAVWYLAGYK